MKKIWASMLAVFAAIVGATAAAAPLSPPATGIGFDARPFIVGGVALVLVIVLIVFTVISKKKK